MTREQAKKLIKIEILKHFNQLHISNKMRDKIINSGNILVILGSDGYMIAGVFKAHNKLFGDVNTLLNDVQKNVELIKDDIENIKKINTIIELD
jgi:hypothetical protein